MEKLIELANLIEDKELRKKVIEIIKDPKLTHKDFSKYPRESIENVRVLFNVGGIISERELLNHTLSVTEVCIKVAEILEKNFGMKFKKDFLIAGALLHDIMKVFEWRVRDGNVEYTSIPLDHTFLGVAELYKRDFPEEVIHMVASHLGETSPTPPRTIEAFILHSVDSMLSIIEHHESKKD